jgi:hypothetical protein
VTAAGIHGYIAYGERARPDAYPHVIYRMPAVRGEYNVGQLIHGQWFVVKGADGKLISSKAIREKAEKGLCVRLPDDAPLDWAGGRVADRPGYVQNVDFCIALPEHKLEAASEGLLFHKDPGESWSYRVVSFTDMQMSGAPWRIVQKGDLWPFQESDLVVSSKPETRYCGTLAAAGKAYKKLRDELREWAHDNSYVLLDINNINTAPAGDLMQDRIAWAANDYLSEREQAQALEEERKREEAEGRLQQAIARLRELTSRPRHKLSTEEFQEKMRLKRELRHVC